MIDPRFANAGGLPLIPGYGAQQVTVHHRRHHRHHRKTKHGLIGESPLSRDESIHKVDHGHHQLQPNKGAPFSAGFGVPYGVGGIHVQQQQQQHPGTHYGFSNQYQRNAYDQGQFGVAAVTKHHRRHHRHHRKHGAEEVNANDQSQAVPEVLIGQRSSSVLSKEAPKEIEGRASVSPVADEPIETQATERKSRRHHSGEHFSSGRIYHARQVQGQVSGGSEGYGHIDKDLIFIERGENSPHRQQPPPGYEFKGKIEVECMEKESRSQSRGRGGFVPPSVVPSIPQQPTTVPTPSVGPCPPGWQQVNLTAGPCGPCPSGGSMFTGQAVGGFGMGQSGFGGYGAGGSFGASASGGGLANLAASFPFPPQGQLVADYIVESSAGGSAGAGISGVISSGGSGFAESHQQTTGGYEFGSHSDQVEEHVSRRAKIIEVWQKRSKSEVRERSQSRSHSPTHPRSRSRSRSHSPKQAKGTQFNFEKFRSEILSAIERIVQTGGSSKSTSSGQSGTQTSIPSYQGGKEKEVIHTSSGGSSSGEVRVIVQPIQPVFYMPRQSEGGAQTTAPTIMPISGSTNPTQQSSSGAPQIVYVPRNVYVPVIKPVFVPRERVIVRPQIIHVARPVLVDRPVPVTQRPIIIDRERPVPVPIRTQAAAQQGTGSKVIREEYVYRDNLPVAYGGRCPEYAGGVNYGYMPAQQEHQYASSSVQEASNGYQEQGQVINVTVPNQFQHSQSAGQLNVQQGGGSFHESFSNVGQVTNASNVGGVALDCTAPIEVLDTTINPSWQRTDKATLVRRFGRPAFEIVEKTDQVEQQMYQELRQRTSSEGIQRSYSAASYGSGSGAANVHANGFAGNNASFSSFPICN